MERRDIETQSNPKPIGLWIDEYQQFCTHKTDSQFQATARSSWVATVYITQNINNIFYVMGNDQPEAVLHKVHTPHTDLVCLVEIMVV